MRPAIDGGAAGVHPDRAVLGERHRLDAPRQRVAEGRSGRPGGQRGASVTGSSYGGTTPGAATGGPRRFPDPCHNETPERSFPWQRPRRQHRSPGGVARRGLISCPATGDVPVRAGVRRVARRPAGASGDPPVYSRGASLGLYRGSPGRVLRHGLRVVGEAPAPGPGGTAPRSPATRSRAAGGGLVADDLTPREADDADWTASPDAAPPPAEPPPPPEPPAIAGPSSSGPWDVRRAPSHPRRGAGAWSSA